MRRVTNILPSRRRGGFTLVELSLGLIVTALMGGALAAFTIAVANCWRYSESTRASVMGGGQITARLEHWLIDAKRIGAYRGGGASSAAMMIWRRDANADGLMQLSELAVIRHNRDDDTLEACTAVIEGKEDDVVWDQSALNDAASLDTFLGNCQATTLISRARTALLTVNSASNLPSITWELQLLRNDGKMWPETVVVTLRAPANPS